MLNKIVIMGRLTRDPELRYTQQNTPVCSYTVAVDRDFITNGEKKTDFVDCVAWRQGGEFVSKYFAKGSLIVVEGRLESRQWTDRDNNKRVTWEINVDHSYFGGSKRETGESSGSSAQAPESTLSRGYEAAQTKFTDIDPDEDDGELPFD